MPVLFALTAVLSTALGGFVALRSRDRLHLVLGFAAGVMLGLVAFDLLPELFELSDTMFLGVPTVMVAFAAGFLLLHCVERSVAMHGAHEGEYGAHHHHNPSVGLASALALVVHSFLDGVGIGLAFQVNDTVGFAVALAVIAHDFADGLNTVTILRTHGNSRRRQLDDARGRRRGAGGSERSRRCSSVSATTCSRSTSAASPAFSSTSRPPTSCPRRTPGTRRGSRW